MPTGQPRHDVRSCGLRLSKKHESRQASPNGFARDVFSDTFDFSFIFRDGPLLAGAFAGKPIGSLLFFTGNGEWQDRRRQKPTS